MSEIEKSLDKLAKLIKIEHRTCEEPEPEVIL